MIYHYELNFPDEGLTVTNTFNDNEDPYDIAESMLKQAMLIRNESDNETEWAGQSILTNLHTKESWNIVSEDYTKITADTNMLQFDPQPIKPAYKYIVYPGSFDPFHSGHAEVVERVQAYLPDYDEFIVLVQDNQFKQALMFNREFRLNLVKSALKNKGIFATWTSSIYLSPWLSEYKLGKASKLGLTRKDITDKYDLMEIHVVIGDDCLDTIQTWHEYESSLNNGKYKFVVVQRTKSINEILELRTVLKNMVVIPHYPLSAGSAISSTSIKAEVNKILASHT